MKYISKELLKDEFVSFLFKSKLPDFYQCTVNMINLGLFFRKTVFGRIKLHNKGSRNIYFFTQESYLD